MGEVSSETRVGVTPRDWMFHDECTGKFKVEEVSNYYIIYQEINGRYLYFFNRKEYVPMEELITYSPDKAKTMLKEVEDLYKPILREKRLAKILGSK